MSVLPSAYTKEEDKSPFIAATCRAASTMPAMTIFTDGRAAKAVPEERPAPPVLSGTTVSMYSFFSPTVTPHTFLIVFLPNRPSGFRRMAKSIST